MEVKPEVDKACKYIDKQINIYINKLTHFKYVNKAYQ